MDQSPIFLIGFMATGKSTVGREAARRMGRRYVDLDEVIERRVGRRIPDIFRADGEPAFRAHEAAALRSAVEEKGVVVACGGGTPLCGDNLARMRGAGVVVALSASVDEILGRIGDPSSRPLLAGPGGARDAVLRLYREREAAYLSADLIVDTDRRDVAAIAEELALRAALRLGDERVHLGERSYPIHLAPTERLGELLAELTGARAVALVTDENVAGLSHLVAAREAILATGARVVDVVVPPGESAKRLAVVGDVASTCVRGGLDRRSAIVAVGGGVVGDLAAFVAATLYRGVACAQVPTTLLAMVDSAVGGKTGVDLPEGKNLLGAFWQPRFVLMDVTVLATLPPRELASACGEVVKMALLGDPALFALLEEGGLPRDLAEVVRRCAAAKARVVEADERESGGLASARALLNLGHTVGHAVEAASWAGASLLHGEAVAVGLVAAARASARLGLCDAALEARIVRVLGGLGLREELDHLLTGAALAHLSVDKKRADGKIRFVALEEVGRVRSIEVDPDDLVRSLR